MAATGRRIPSTFVARFATIGWSGPLIGPEHDPVTDLQISAVVTAVARLTVATERDGLEDFRAAAIGRGFNRWRRRTAGRLLRWLPVRLVVGG
jgi:hypothetical protein